ncbi:MAG: SGNH/GDSL hydrolase family protein [Bacteroidia bacterium]
MTAKPRPESPPNKQGRSIWGKVKAMLIGTVVALIILEVFLRIWSPFGARVQGGKIVLPAGITYDLKRPEGANGLDEQIHHSKNSLGFRGPEKPEDWNAAQTIVAVGGSTTECFYLSDGKDWPAQLYAKLHPSHPNLWINNAGLDGHSTFGHQMLLDDYVAPQKPDYVLLMCGVNDIGIEQMRSYDADAVGNKGFMAWLARNSSIFGTIANLRRAANARKAGLTHSFVDIKALPELNLPQDSIDRAVSAQASGRAAFGQRVEKLISTCKKAGIKPILVTQALLWGDTIDPVSGVNLGNRSLLEGGNGNQRLYVLESYNDVLRKTATQTGTPLIDLAAIMPKSTEYFYDAYHFTNAGAAKVAALLAPELENLLQNP